jgi:hypothetical protein
MAVAIEPDMVNRAQKTENRRQKTENGGQRTEDREQIN